MNACRTAQIAVSNDLAVIGVDDDDAFCMLCDPPLSSVRTSAELVGYRAAELLQDMLSRFKEELGRTPHEEITALQIERVKQLLRETDMTLEQIAPKAGYAHKESLSAVFKRETSLTPGAYRRRGSK